MSDMRTPRIGLLATFVFLLFCVPRLNTKIGPIPVYAIDVVSALLIYYTALAKDTAVRIAIPFKSIILIIGFLIVVSEFALIVYGGSPVEALYIAIRYILTFGVLFATPLLVRTRADVEVLVKALVLALVITSSLMIMSSLPQTRRFTVPLFSISYFEPSNTASRLLEGAGESATRGRTLIGVSILSGAFISIAWPFLAYFRSYVGKLSAFWSLASLLAITLSPLAVVVSYSRQAAVGGIMIALAALVFPFGRLRSSLMRPVYISVGLVVFVGVGSSLFFFDRYVDRFQATINAPLEHKNESARVLSYVVPFEHVTEHPQFLIVGAGSILGRFPNATIKPYEENHSLMGAGHLAHGMLSTLMLYFVIFALYRYANLYRKRAQHYPTSARGWPRALYLAYLPILPMAAFAPAFGTSVRAMYVFMLLYGLLVTLRNPALMASLSASPQPKLGVQRPPASDAVPNAAFTQGRAT